MILKVFCIYFDEELKILFEFYYITFN